MEVIGGDSRAHMRFATANDPTFLKHKTASHVERPERLAAVQEMLEKTEFSIPFLPVATREATDEELLLCHEPEVLERVVKLTENGGGNLDPDTYVNAWSDRAARLAVGSGIDLTRAVLQGEYDRGFVFCRPPGHHATPTKSMGFCLYSTIAIVAKACADLAQRILIFDWDVHHGNGTQDRLYDHSGTQFVSIHQGQFYPGTGYPDERGEGEGKGAIFNIPLPRACGDAEYLETYKTLVRPIIRQYDPELILVSAGYDAHQDDLLGGMNVTAQGFAQLAEYVKEDALATAAKGRIVGFLEGGYHLGGLSESLRETLRVWTGDSSAVTPNTRDCNDQIKRLLKRLSDDFEL